MSSVSYDKECQGTKCLHGYLKNQQTNVQVKIDTLDKRTSVERFQKRKKTFDQLHYLNFNSDVVVM